MSIHRTQAIVLNRHDCRETSLIVNFYTRDYGKISGLLKGIRSCPSKFASSIEPFSFNEIVFYKNRNAQLHLVSQCDLRDNFNETRKNIFKIGLSSVMMELLNLIMAAEDKNTDVFDLTLACLKEIEVSNNPSKIASIFKIKMLELSGFKPHLDSCVSCGSRVDGQSKFSLSRGGLLCLKCCAKDNAARAIFRGTIATIMHIEKNDLKNNLNLGMNPQIKKELELLLNSFLNFHLEKELKSQKVLNKLEISPAGGGRF